MPADPTRLEIETVADGKTGRLRLSGDLDADSVRSLVLAGDRLLADGHRHLIIDCTDLTFCDSFGLHALTRMWDQVQPDGSVTIDQPSTTLTRILEITGLAHRFGPAMSAEHRLAASA